ncbi:MAG TPA: 2-dehydropantoate 2-reductase, partial [bacterium]|nr:2-dehydropantoate 2-reductase [bacterium]
MTVAPQFIVIGAGGIGGVTGAHLARAGYAVLLVDRAREHVRAVAERGLAVEGAASFHVRVPAVTPDALAPALAGRAARTVLLAVNAQDTAAALEPVVPLLGEESVVVSMQNGLNERLIAERI